MRMLGLNTSDDSKFNIIVIIIYEKILFALSDMLRCFI